MDLQNNKASRVASLDELGVTIERDGKETKFIPWGEDAEARAAAASAQETADAAQGAAEAAAQGAAAAQETADAAQTAAEAAQETADAAQTAAASAQETADAAQTAADAAQGAADGLEPRVTANEEAIGNHSREIYEAHQEAVQAQTTADAAQGAADAAQTTADEAAELAAGAVQKEVTGDERIQNAGKALAGQDGTWLLGINAAGSTSQYICRTAEDQTLAKMFADLTNKNGRIQLISLDDSYELRAGFWETRAASTVPAHTRTVEINGAQVTCDYRDTIIHLKMDGNARFFIGVYAAENGGNPVRVLGAGAYSRAGGTVENGATLAVFAG